MKLIIASDRNGKAMIDIETYIPSQTYIKFLRDSRIELNVSQMAKLLYISRNALEDKWAGYRALIASDKIEPVLRKTLECIIGYEEKFVEGELQERSDTVYILEALDPEDDFRWEEMGIYASLRAAERLGRKTGQEFTIRRHCVKPLIEEEVLRAEEKILKEGCPEETCEQIFYYGADGRLRNLDHMDNEGGSDNPEYDAYSDAVEYVENIFADFPLCFQNGDIIRMSDTYGRWRNAYGIIHVFPDRKEQNERILQRAGCSPDDVELVEFMDEDGEFSHEHIPVVELEMADWDEIPKDKQLVLRCASDLVKGRGTIDVVQFCILQMKRGKQGEAND